MNKTDSELLTTLDDNNNKIVNVSTSSSAELTGEINVEALNSEINSTDTGRSRKRKRNPDIWKQNVRKKRRQSGQSYENIKGKNVRSREVKNKGDCNRKCKFRCTESFLLQDRKQIFDEFWSLSDNFT